MVANHELKSPQNYLLSSVNRSAEEIEFLGNHDQQARLCDLDLLHYFFRVTEIEGNIEEKLYQADLSKFALRTLFNSFTYEIPV